MVWDNRKTAAVAGLGAVFVIEICLAIYILFPSTPALPETATIPAVTSQPKQPTQPPTEKPINTLTQTIEPTPTQIPAATPTDLLPITFPTICLPQDTKRDYGRVTKVIDGDNIEVEIEGINYRVRYIGMDTPEDEYEASRYNSDQVLGKEVVMVKDVSETDQNDRLLRYVLVGESFVNYELVSAGFANAVAYPPNVACEQTFREAEQEAIDECRGFWCPTATPLPTLPVVIPSLDSVCDPSYPDPGVCIPSYPPDLDCRDIGHRGFTVLPPDPHGFDDDNDGLGCESG
jgi:micrococcal nuclease